MIETTFHTLTDWQKTIPETQIIQPVQQIEKKYTMQLKNVTPRLYQETILSTCAEKNCLVVLPTGMGKTVIALMLAIQRIKNFPKCIKPDSNIKRISHTKPLRYIASARFLQ